MSASCFTGFERNHMRYLLSLLNWMLLVSIRRYLKIQRYYLNDRFWGYKNNYVSTTTIQDRLYRLLERRDFAGLHIVQVGAHNGIDNNTLSIQALTNLPDTTLILIEPHPKLFDDLCANYAQCENVKCLNVAISTNSDTRSFYTVDESPELPTWVNQISTFDKDHILKFSTEIPTLKNHVRETIVKCLTAENVIDTYLDGSLDVILIDVEGYDANIVQSIPLMTRRPSIIYYEHKHLTADDIAASMKYLAKHGYSFAHTEFDTLAFIDK